MDERYQRVAGLQTCLINAARAADTTVVFLHGYGMRAADLAPFAHSLDIPGVSYAFPQAPLPAASGGFAWWPMAEAMHAGPLQGARDLAAIDPPGRHTVRRMLRELLAELGARTEGRSIILAGFSQGGMLACDTLLFEDVRVAGLVLMSASCIAVHDWQARIARLHGVASFVSHGRADPDLAFGAGERLKNLLLANGVPVTWVPFDGGHEIPFLVWRQFRQFTHATRRAVATNEKSLRYATH